ncbi:hypothetical protein IGJ55_002599 [Enterococcus sp. AZ170]|uniref:glycosyltransferase n=1 Tax=unclassified Enterococcus TaxID=2608891 RepID=UPI003D2D23E5
MRGVYLSPNVSHNPGINQKVLNQVEAFKETGADICLIMDNRSGKLKKLQTAMPIFSKQFDRFFPKKLNNYDFVYIRKPYYFDFDFIRKLSTVKKSGTQIILEIPTYPYDSEFKHKILMFPTVLKDKLSRKMLKRYVSRIVTFSDDEEIFGIKTIQTFNAFDFKSTNLSKKVNYSSKMEITLIAVANIENWHGYDRLIIGLSEYYLNKKDDDPDFKIFIVGGGNKKIIQLYKKMIFDNDLTDRIILTDKKTGKELDELFSSADIGVDSLGRHRSKVYYNSSLKGKEYLGRGLPIISGVETELDNPKYNFPYYMRVSADDSPINFKDIILFFEKIHDNKNAYSIKKFGEENFSFKASVKPVIDYLKENEGKHSYE